MGNKLGSQFHYEACAQAALQDYQRYAATCADADSRQFAVEMVAYYQRHFPTIPKKTTSQYRGVSRDKNHSSKFSARICVRGRQIRLGCFDTEEEAAHAYDAEVKRRQLNYPLNFKETK